MSSGRSVCLPSASRVRPPTARCFPINRQPATSDSARSEHAHCRLLRLRHLPPPPLPFSSFAILTLPAYVRVSLPLSLPPCSPSLCSHIHSPNIHKQGEGGGVGEGRSSDTLHPSILDVKDSRIQITLLPFMKNDRDVYGAIKQTPNEI